MELYIEPREIALSKITKVEREPEMSPFDSSFVCGVIRKIKPRKILEVGVAAGGSTAIILECLKQLGLEKTCEVISVDLSTNYWRDSKAQKPRRTGFQTEEYLKNTNVSFNYQLLTGNVLPAFIDAIGNEIDLVILDTAHMLPGELLDYIVVLPYVKKHGIIILHDIALSHYKHDYHIATQIVFDAAVGNKYIPIDCFPANKIPLPNIGLIELNDDTIKYIESAFYALTLPWKYMPSNNDIEKYRKQIGLLYEKRLLELFDTAINLNCGFLNGK